MIEAIHHFLMTRGLAPHGYCLLWDPVLIWTHVVSDALTAAAYFSIPLVLFRLLKLRQDVTFGWMVGLFAVFIFACGATHVMGIVTLWIPAYGLQGLIKAVTAIASVATAALLIPLLPRLVEIPSPAALQRANDALVHEAKERERTEAMLRQAQKMEAIGHLTGGVAHDFNNLLGVVIANIDRVRRKGGMTEQGDGCLANALAAAERAARLTDQLLAFAKRQPLQTKPNDLNAIVERMAELIAETVGRKIEVTADLARPLPDVIVDCNQLENAILNLAINSRDAMPDGGRLVIATRNAQQGFVELSVRDSGTGMDEATLSQATEPFFTTKAIGKGSGLGLSQVIGTVEQQGGRVELESQLGVGTTVRLFLPSQELE